MVIGDLPNGWEWTTLGEVTKINGRDIAIRDLPDDLPVTFLPMAAVDAEQGIIAQPEERPLKDVRKGFTPFSDGDVLFAKITPSMENGKAAIARKLKNGRGFGSTEFHVFRPKDAVTSEWVFHFIRQEHFRKDAKAHFAGTAGQLRVPASFLADYPFPLPPLPEQERIVAKIEELFTQLEAGTAALERVQAGLKRYKASVLKAAVEGKLGIQNDEGRTQDDGQLPAGWKEVEFKEIITSLKNGYFYGRPSSEPIGIPILRISAVRPMSVNYSDLRYVPKLKEEDVENYFLSKGDLLFTRYNGNLSLVGACGLVREGSQRVIYPDKLIRVRVQNEIALPEYLEIYFSTILARKLIESKVKSTAGQHGISGGDIKSLSVILPPLEEQRQIVAEVERRLSLAAGVESTLAASMSRAGRLRQAVLKSAFEGRLV